jgi:hypothetical protein
MKPNNLSGAFGSIWTNFIFGWRSFDLAGKPFRMLPSAGAGFQETAGFFPLLKCRLMIP